MLIIYIYTYTYINMAEIDTDTTRIIQEEKDLLEKKKECLQYNFIIGKTPTERKLDSVMKKTDTFHDMWDKHRGEDIQYILKELKRDDWNSKDPNIYIEDEMYGAKINDIELDGESFFEETIEIPSICKSNKFGNVMFDIKDIMDNYQEGVTGGHKPNTYLTKLLTNKIITSISITTPNGDNEQKKIYKNGLDNPITKKLNYVANYIKSFFQYNSLEDKQFLFPIDANCGPLPSIFQHIDKCNTLATALTICDSAGGGVNEKK